LIGIEVNGNKYITNMKISNTTTIPTIADEGGIYFVKNSVNPKINGIYVKVHRESAIVPIANYTDLISLGITLYDLQKSINDLNTDLTNKVDKDPNRSLILLSDVDKLANLSGNNTGDQDLSALSTKAEVAAISGGQLGTLNYNSVAPTPGKNGYYIFSNGGITLSWLGGITVKGGDTVTVLFTTPSTYDYTYIDTHDRVSTLPQTLLTSEENQVRANIKAAAISDIDKLSMSQQIIEANGINTITGADTDATNRMRSYYLHYDLIKSITINPLYVFRLYFYDKNKTFLSYTTTWYNTYNFIPDQTKFYVRIVLAYANTTTPFIGTENLGLVLNGLNEYTDLLNTIASQNKSLILGNNESIKLNIGLIRPYAVSYLLGGALNGAISISNGFRIPIGSTGQSSFFYIIPNLQAYNTLDYIGKVIKCDVVIKITNYDSLTPAQIHPYLGLKQMQGVSTIIASTNPDITTYTDSIINNILTRSIHYERTVTTTDIANGYWYKSYFQIDNTKITTAIVDITLDSFSLTQTYITTYLDDYQNSNNTANSIITTTLSDISNKLTRTETIGNQNIISTGATSTAGTCVLDYSTFTKVGRLTIFNIKLSAAGDFYLVQFRKNGTTWNEITRTTLTGIIGSQTFDLTYLNLQTVAGDCFGIQNKIGSAAFFNFQSGQIGKSYKTISGSTPLSFTDSTFPNTASPTNNAFCFNFKIELNIDERVTNIENQLLGGIVSKTNLQKSFSQYTDESGSYTQIKIKKDGTGDYTNQITAAIAIRNLATIDNKYEFLIYDDWSGFVASDYLEVPTALGSYAIFWVPKNTRLRGIGRKRFVYGTLPNGLTQNIYAAYQTVYGDGGGDVINIYTNASAIRYPFHHEHGTLITNKNTNTNLTNIFVEHLGVDMIDTNIQWYAPDGYGMGCASGQRVNVKNSTFKAINRAFRAHTNIDFTDPCYFNFENSKFISTTSVEENNYAVYLDELGSKQDRFITMVGCQLTGKFASLVGTFNNNSIEKILSPAQIRGYGNTPFLFEQGIGEAVLRINSLTTGNTSKIIIIQDDADLLGRVTYVNGSLELKGYAYGENPLLESNVVDKKNMIGHKLGDCTIINKFLIINIDGINRTITFNKNYSGGNTLIEPIIQYATILSDINIVITGYGLADWFFPIGEYYVELSDVLYDKFNTSITNPILKSYLVKYTGISNCRKALQNEIPDAIAIDNIPIQQFGRTIKHCIVIPSGRFAPLMETPIFVEGDKFKVSANGKLIVDNTLLDSNFIAISDTKILIK